MPRTVLVVDDDPFFQQTLADGLRAAGYQVSVAANGLEAIEAVRQSPPDFILLDLIMPKLDGIRVCKLLKRHPEHRRIPVIILTGAVREGLKVLDGLGADATVAKREAAVTLPEILKTLQLLEAAPQQPRPPEEAAAGLAERRIVSELLAERRRTQTVLDTLGEGVVELDEAGHVVYVNAAGQAILGRTEDELLGHPGADLLGPSNAPALQQALRAVQAEAEAHTARLQFVHGQKTIGVTLTALRVPEGAPGALLVLRDLTDLTRRARSLQALAEVGQHILAKLDLATVLREIVTRAAKLLEAERCALFQIERSGDRLRLRCVQALGLSPRYALDLFIGPGETVVGKALEERRPVYTANILQDPVIRLSDDLRNLVQAEGIGAVLAAPILLPDEAFGTLTVYRPAGHRFTRDEVDLATSLAASAAIAIENARLYEELRGHSEELEAKVAERTHELQTVNRELELASRHKSEFLANMSHELRTPLHAMAGYADLLLGAAGDAPGALNERQQRYLENIRANGDRLLEFINDLLDLAKVEAGRMPLDLTEVSVAAALQEAVNTAKVQALRKQIGVTLHVGEAPKALVLDLRKVQQILGNLLSNAIKFSPAGGSVSVEARAVPDPRGWALEVAVRDTGIGIAPEEHGRLFQEFVQLDNSLAKRHQGTGLGLALTKRLVELHRGRIWAASPGPGKGATFTFRLPCRPDPLTGEVLVVEDDEKVRAVIREVLAERGLRVREAPGGLEGLSMIQDAAPDLVLLDLRMPLMHGYRVIRNLRRRPETAGIPILVVTGVGDEDGRVALTQGADAYLTKPFQAGALVEAVERLLERRDAEALVTS